MTTTGRANEKFGSSDRSCLANFCLPTTWKPRFQPGEPLLRHLTPQPCKIIWPKTDDWFWSHLETKAPCRDGQHPSEWAKKVRSDAVGIFWQYGLGFMVMRQSSFAMATKPESRRHSICNRKLGNRNHKHNFPKYLTFNRLQTRLFFLRISKPRYYFFKYAKLRGVFVKKKQVSWWFLLPLDYNNFKGLGKGYG